MIESQRPITVAMLIQTYHPHIGGAENQLRALVPRLQARNIRPVVLTRQLAATSRMEVLDGAPIYRFNARSPKLRAGAEYVLGALQFLVARRAEIDVLHAHELLSPATIGLLAKWCSGLPLLVKVLRGGRLSDLRALRRRPFGSARWVWYRRSVDRFIAISDEIERELAVEGVKPDRIARIPNGVDIDVFRPVGTDQKSDLRRKLGLADGPTTIYAGRLATEKRTETIVMAWPDVRARVKDAQLLLVGDGPSAATLRKLATEGVTLLGARDDVAPYFQASDLFILPSVAEGLSNAMLEAMACGLACVVHPLGGALDAIENGVSGAFLADDTEGSITATVSDLLLSADARAEMGAQARAVVVDRYSLDAVADQLAALYRQLAKSRRRSPTCAA